MLSGPLSSAHKLLCQVRLILVPSAVILLLESTMIIGDRIIDNYCGLNNCLLADYWVEKYVLIIYGLLQF